MGKYDKLVCHAEISTYLAKIGIKCKFFTNRKFGSISTIIAVSVFKIEDAYKKGTKYYNGLRKIALYMKKIKRKIILRVYYDNSILDTNNKTHGKEISDKWIPLFEKMNNITNIQLIRFQCDNFLGKDTIMHRGLFGTIIRLFPSFDFTENKYIKYSVCCDIDSYVSFIRSILYMNNINKWKYDVAYGSYVCKYLDNRMFSEFLNKHDFKFRINASTFYVRKRISKTVLCEFLKCIEEKCKQHTNWVKLINGTKIRDGWDYGIDEFLLNDWILVDLLKKKYKIGIFLYQKVYDAGMFYLTESKMYEKFDSETEKLWLDLFQNIMGDSSKYTLSEYFEKIDYMIWKSEKGPNDVRDNFIKEVLKIIKTGRDKLYHMPQKMVECFKVVDKYNLYDMIDVKYSNNKILTEITDKKLIDSSMLAPSLNLFY